jgi:hypothetical protein
MRKRHWSHKLAVAGACGSALRWARRQPSFAVAWEKCTYPGWLAYCLAGYKPNGDLYWKLVGGSDASDDDLPVTAETREDKARCEWIRENYKRPALPTRLTSWW